MTELRTKTALLFSPEANEPWFWQRQNRRRNWKVQRSQPELFRCDEYIWFSFGRRHPGPVSEASA
jgi:hypothetical protein